MQTTPVNVVGCILCYELFQCINIICLIEFIIFSLRLCYSLLVIQILASNIKFYDGVKLCY